MGTQKLSLFLGSRTIGLKIIANISPIFLEPFNQLLVEFRIQVQGLRNRSLLLHHRQHGREQIVDHVIQGCFGVRLLAFKFLFCEGRWGVFLCSRRHGALFPASGQDSIVCVFAQPHFAFEFFDGFLQLHDSPCRVSDGVSDGGLLFQLRQSLRRFRQLAFTQRLNQFKGLESDTHLIVGQKIYFIDGNVIIQIAWNLIISPYDFYHSTLDERIVSSNGWIIRLLTLESRHHCRLGSAHLLCLLGKGGGGREWGADCDR